jgi:general secretion pathway protein N
MRAGAFVVLGIAAYFVFMVVLLPASYVAAQVQGMSRGLEITDARGTIWRGDARIRAVVGNTVVTLDRLSWRWLPSRLLRGEMAYRTGLDLNRFELKAELGRSLNGWEARDVEGAGDAGALAAFAPLLATWRVAGPIRVSAPRVSLRGNDIRGDARIEWRDATTALSDVRPLGSYEAAWRAGIFEVKTLQGPLRISGKGTAAAGASFAFGGEARGEGEQAKALEPLLDLIGPRRPDGARAIELRTQ